MNDFAQLLFLLYALVGLVYGAYFLGLHRGRGPSTTDGLHPFRFNPLAWCLAIPVAFLVVYFSLALHLRLALGRWPEAIGDNPDSWWLHLHAQAAWWCAVGIAYSLLLLPAVFVVCLAVRRWVRFSAYLIAYAVVAVAGFGLMHAAPASFVGWFWD